MKKTLYLFLLLSFLSLSNYHVWCQDLNYTQYFNSQINVNPAFTGLTTGLKARFLFRDQWPKLPVDLKSYYFSADIGDRNLPGAGGLGIIVLSDNPGYGLINSLTLGITFAVNIPLNRFSTFQVGIKAAMLQKKINWNDLTFSDQLDKRLGAIYNSDFISPDAGKRIAPDFGAGGIFQFGNQEGTFSGNAGVAVDHLFKPDISFFTTENSRIQRKWVIHGDFISMLSHGSGDPLKLEIGALYQNQDKFNALQFGLNLVKYNIYLGTWYKTTLSGSSPNNVLAIDAGFKYTFSDQMSIKFLYSYDIQVSGALMGTGGAHEISLVLDLANISLFGNGSGRGGKGGGYILPNRAHSNMSPLECSEF